MKMNYRIGHITTAGGAKELRSDPGILNAIVPGVDYDALARLVLEQYSAGGNTDFEALLSIPNGERIPALSAEYGTAQMKQLMRLMLTHYFSSIDAIDTVPSKASLRATTGKMYALAQSHLLSLEDVIIVLEGARLSSDADPACATPTGIVQRFRQYCTQRHEAYENIMLQREQGLKQLGPLLRVASEPTPIEALIPGALIIDMTKKMSG
jgi:hypothetical protein